MKNFNLVLVFLAIIVTSCTSKVDNALYRSLALKGNVKRATFFKYRAIEKFGEYSKGLNKNFWSANFNPIDYSGVNDFKFDIENKLLEANIISREDDEPHVKIKYEYNEDGQVEKIDAYNFEGKLTARTITDHKNNLRKEYNDKGELTVLWKDVQFSDDGLIIKSNNYKINETTGSEELYSKMEKKDNFFYIHSIDSETGKAVSEIELKYLNNDFLVNRMKKGKLDLEITYNENNLVETYKMKKTYGKNYDNYRYEYIYDKRGNWIQCIEWQNEKLTFVYERTIQYWD